MKIETKIRLFKQYTDYWIIKLGLEKKYKITVKQDNRVDCMAETVSIKPSKEYEIHFNTKQLTGKIQIIQTVLHEVGHLLHSWKGKEGNHEAFAEYFALSTAKTEYPQYYKQMIKFTRERMKDKDLDEAHKQGYMTALNRMGEL